LFTIGYEVIQNMNPLKLLCTKSVKLFQNLGGTITGLIAACPLIQKRVASLMPYLSLYQRNNEYLNSNNP